MNEIPVIEQNRQRFDIISIFREPGSKAEKTKYIWQKREVERNHATCKYKNHFKLIRNWLKCARSLPLPTIKEECQDMLDNYACDIEARGFKRRRESLKRFVISRARLKMKSIAEEEEAEEVMKFYNMMLLHEQQAIAVSKRPVIETRDICIEILKKGKSFGGYTVKDLMETARKDSERVSRYIGSGSVDLEHNRHVKNVVELLLQHENIKKIKNKPIVLQWIDDATTPPPTNPTGTSDASTKEENNQKSTFWRIFDELVSKDAQEPGMEKEVLETRFIEALVSTDEFTNENIDVMIKDAENDGLLERIVTQVDGVTSDILRKKCHIIRNERETWGGGFIAI